MKLNLAFLKSKWSVLLPVFIVSTFRVNFNACAQHIPDTNFANAIRSACPTYIDVSNNLLPPAASLTNLDVSGKNIADLTGIGGFT